MAKGINKAEKNGNWNGGVWVTNRGYRKLLVHGHPRADRDGYVLEHVIVMEESIGRRLNKGEVIHHKNHDKTDNSIDNLMLFATHADHIRFHADERGRKTKTVTCSTCGAQFTKRTGAIKQFNFCSKTCVNPQLWIQRR